MKFKYVPKDSSKEFIIVRDYKITQEPIEILDEDTIIKLVGMSHIGVKPVIDEPVEEEKPKAASKAKTKKAAK